jgi:hypothetical protein
MTPYLTEEHLLKEAQARNIVVDPCDIEKFKTSDIEAMLAPVVVDGDDEFKEEDLFKKGASVPADLIHLETQSNNPPSGIYMSELLLESERTARLLIKDINTGQRLAYQLVFNAERGIRAEGESTVDRSFDDFVFQQYTHWCGKWHGKNRKWRVCTGKDCSDGIICLEWERKWV